MRYDDIGPDTGGTAAEARAAYDLDTPDLDEADLDEVLRLLDYVWGREVGKLWLDGENAFLDGSRPINVLRIDGPEPVIAALRAVLGGSYA